MEYLRLTKEKIDNTGRNIITCRFKDTDKCPIHSCGGCGKCDIFNQMLEQLHGFENMLEELIRCGSETIYDKLI